MSKRRHKPRQSTAANTAASTLGLDSFQNTWARTGYGTPNLMQGTHYPITRLTQNYGLMNSLYRNSWLVRRIIDIIPKDMLKNGWKYESDISPEDTGRLQKAERVTRLCPALLRGLNWGRLYGGAAALMMIEGQEESLEEPLDLDSVMPGDFKGLLITDRWSGIYPQLALVDDISHPEFGLPAEYEFRDWAQKKTFRVHHSRIIRFVGDDLPEWERLAESYWGASKIESTYEELKKRDNTSANIALLVFQARLNVLKLSGLDVLLGSGNQKAKEDFYGAMQAQNWLQSNFGTKVIGAEDDFQSINYTFSGLNDIYESFMLDMSGATQIPVTKLFGRAPAGMNATGESDMRNYYDVVEQDQEAHLRPALEKLLPVLCMSTLGHVPDDMEISFNPVATPSDKEMADLLKVKSEIVLAWHDHGIFSDRLALKEGKQMSEGTGFLTNITDEDIAKASDEPKALLPDLEDPSLEQDPQKAPQDKESE